MYVTTRHQMDSSSSQEQQHQTYTTTNPPFNTNKTTTDHFQREPRRHLPTCADDIEFCFSGTQRVTTTRHSHRPPHTHLLFVLLLRCLLSTSFIFSHTADTFIVTTTPNSPTTLYPFFPSDNLSSYNLTGFRQQQSPDAVRTQP